MWRIRLFILLGNLVAAGAGAIIAFFWTRYYYPGVGTSVFRGILVVSACACWVFTAFSYVLSTLGREATAEVTVLVHDEEGGEHNTKTAVPVLGRWVGSHKNRRFVIVDTREL